MIISGSRGKVVDLGEAEVHRCQMCGRDRRFHLFMEYRYWHLYYLFGVVTKERYLMLCEACQRGWELEAKKVKRALPRIPIPFMQRFGLLMFGSMIAVLVCLAAVFGR